MTDRIVQVVTEKFKSRSRVGIEKYGTTLCRNEAEILERLTHLEEELMDGLLYLQWIKEKLAPTIDYTTDTSNF
jgi:hypothetical protein